jgi:hypothetical protein
MSFTRFLEEVLPSGRRAVWRWVASLAADSDEAARV